MHTFLSDESIHLPHNCSNVRHGSQHHPYRTTPISTSTTWNFLFTHTRTYSLPLCHIYYSHVSWSDAKKNLYCCLHRQQPQHRTQPLPLMFHTNFILNVPNKFSRDKLDLVILAHHVYIVYYIHLSGWFSTSDCDHSQPSKFIKYYIKRFLLSPPYNAIFSTAIGFVVHMKIKYG